MSILKTRSLLFVCKNIRFNKLVTNGFLFLLLALYTLPKHFFSQGNYFIPLFLLLFTGFAFILCINKFSVLTFIATVIVVTGVLWNIVNSCFIPAPIQVYKIMEYFTLFQISQNCILFIINLSLSCDYHELDLAYYSRMSCLLNGYGMVVILYVVTDIFILMAIIGVFYIIISFRVEIPLNKLEQKIKTGE